MGKGNRKSQNVSNPKYREGYDSIKWDRKKKKEKPVEKEIRLDTEEV